MSLTASTTMSVATLPTVRARDQCRKHFKPIVSVPAGLHPLGMQSQQLINNSRRLRCPVQEKRASIICAAALNARCAEGQTQTVTRESSTITVAPVQGKEKSPELDDGGTGFPPRDDDGGGGGGGGGGGHWKGGFFFFGFLAFLGLLKDQEEEGPYRDQRRR
ncbi:protein YELLOW LEAF 1, choloroplastic [Capsicum chacoense]|uniref:protein YELLOW LEAF 1, choloroplastic n=1 Tax=Capsicum annuum TaxID=4072 RepID=UPI0007BF9127|nr:protein YELLOW LEAF 1, choloroplastic [Capsicum annuum]XP_016549545.1 protein YELLOW LEAF 1, choloroplastic [Capsicum annuum]